MNLTILDSKLTQILFKQDKFSREEAITEIRVKGEAKEANLMGMIEVIIVAINRNGTRIGDRNLKEDLGAQEEMI